ncbi:MAG: DUF4231 domain-containing protein [bacterium]|nr:DUF4231 domain-containing protein [bacterium]
MSETETSPKTRTTIEDAWYRFAVYDKNANLAQRRFTWLRTWIVILGVAATGLAICYSVAKTGGRPSPEDWRFYLWLLVILTPITGSVLTAGSAKFERGVHWILLRGAAEAVKREIYRYRAQVGIYGPTRAQSRSRDQKLAGKLEEIARRLMDSEVVQASLAPYEEARLPPKYGVAVEDDGLSDLSTERYIEVRLHDQRNYYQSKSARLYRTYQGLQWSIVALGGVGTLLAAVGLEIWIPISVSVAAALTGLLELRRIESSLSAFTRAALELENIATCWGGTPPQTKAGFALREKLVDRTEAVIRNENAGWIEEMQEALTELDEEEPPEEPPAEKKKP